MNRKTFFLYRYSEDKSSSSIYCPPIKQPKSGRTRSLYRSLDANIESISKPKLSSRYTPKTARSVTIRWTDQSIGTFTTVNRFLKI